MERNKWIRTGNSSLISGYKYDGANFYVEFKSNGAIYVYFDVMPFLADSIDPEAPGKDIKVKIIGGGFKYKKIFV